MEAQHVTFTREIEDWRWIMRGIANRYRHDWCDYEGADLVDTMIAESDKSGEVTPEQVAVYDAFVAKRAEEDEDETDFGCTGSGECDCDCDYCFDQNN